MDKGRARERRAPRAKMATNPTVATTEMKPGWSLMTAKGIAEEGQASDSLYTSDAALVRACVDGRPGAFDVLMQRHQRHVYQLCYRFAGNHEDASDLSQDVFLRVHRGLGRFKGNAALSTWLYRIAVNVSLNYVSLTRPKTEEVEPERLFDRRSASPVELVARGERSEMVRAAIAKLPDKQRATLILRVYHDLTHREIAEILGNSVGAVKANFFHALANLKKQLGSEAV